MQDQSKTKQELIQDLASLKQKIKELEQSESERKRNEEALRRTEENFRRSLDDSPLGIRIVTIEGETIYANRAILDIYSYEDLKTTPLKKRYTPESYAEHKIRRRKRKRGDYVPSEYEISIIRKDGEVRNLQVYRKEILWDGERQFQVTYQDITDRKRAEEALRKSEANYRQLFDNSPTGIYQVDFRTGKFSKANDAFCEYFGYSQEEITSLSPYDILTNESKRLFSERLNKLLLGDKLPENPEFEIISKNGKRKWVQLNTKYIYDSEGLAGADVVGHDITERKRVEEALRKSEEKYRAIIENMQEGYHEVDIKGNFTFLNESMCKISGYEREELLGMNNRQYTDEENARKVYQVYNRVYRTGEPVKNFEWQIIRKGGDRRDIEVSISLIKDAEGHPTGFRGLVRDTTDRKLAEEKLQQTLESLRKAVGATVHAIAVTVETRDPYTAGHQRRVADLARAIATEMNLPTDQIDGIYMAAFIHDLGKISIPAEILSKTSKLIDLEFGIIKTHAQSGFDILKDVEFPWPIARMILEHHERMDGSGYPNGLDAGETLLESRILSVADVVESMASHRPYRPAFDIDVVLKEIENNRRTRYDTSAVDACLKIFRANGYQLKQT
ncbi:MAG: PAS domain S-box protein [Syntrophales bacterium]